MEKENKLKALIATGPNPAKGLQGLVLSQFRDIAKARALLWGWREIAEALGMPGREKALSVAYARVRSGVEAGRLEPATAAAPPARQAQTRTVQPTHPTQPGTTTDTDRHYPLPGEKPRHEALSEMDEIRAQFPD